MLNLKVVEHDFQFSACHNINVITDNYIIWNVGKHIEKTRGNGKRNRYHVGQCLQFNLKINSEKKNLENRKKNNLKIIFINDQT